MSGKENRPAGAASGNERHDLRLMTMLRGMVREQRLKGAAETLGLDPRTVQSSLDRGELSELVRIALERHVLADGDERAAQQRERTEALERRVDDLESEFRNGLEAARKELNDGMETLGKQRARAGEERMPAVPAATKAPSPAPPQPTGPERIGGGRRRYPELVFMEPEHDDREVYGDAWPLVEEWREIWKAGHRGTGRGLAWLRAEERVRTLEVAMLEEHGLTLPPEKMPLYGLDRRDQLVWRRKALCDARKALVWAELRGRLRRTLTFGRWRD